MPTAISTVPPTYRKAALGFLLGGVLMGVIGPLTVAWRYELDRDPRTIGLHFLAFNASLLIAGVLSQSILRHISRRDLSIAACVAGSLGFIGLALAAPPASVVWRIAGVSLVGCAAGALLTSLLHFIRPHYENRAASTINFCSLMFGLGCLFATLLIGVMYPLLQVRWQTLVLAAVPLVLAPFVLRQRTIPIDGAPVKDRPRSHPSLDDLRRPAVMLFSALLFFQFGNEWGLATWLPLFLIHRLGISPQSAIYILGVYFLALITGRLMAHVVLLRMNHTRLLFLATAAAMFGYLLLSLTDSTLGAALASVVTGLAYAPIYALVAEKIGHRFDYEPGFFNGIFSIAVTGGMLMPWALGFAGYYIGMQHVLLIPAIASAVVLILVLLIMLEATLMRNDPESPASKTTGEHAVAGR